MRRLLVLPLLLSACSGGSTPTAAPVATPTPTAASPAPRPTSTAPGLVVTTRTTLTSFRTPDGSVDCEVDQASARCATPTHTWTAPPKPADCHEEWGFGVEYSLGSRGTFFCAASRTISATTVLPVGHALKVGLVQCAVLTTGVSCSGTGAPGGFRISASRYTLL